MCVCIYIYIYLSLSLSLSPPSLLSLPLPHSTPLGHHRAAPGWAPCVIEQLPTSFPFYAC